MQDTFKNTLFVVLAYNPQKKSFTPFLEPLAISIDQTASENKTLFFVQDFNIGYLHEKRVVRYNFNAIQLRFLQQANMHI